MKKSRQYSSTTLRYFTDHCPQAMEFHFAKEVEDRRYEHGIAAHAVIQHVGRNKITSATGIIKASHDVAKKLIRDGYLYYGEQQSPLNPDLVQIGRGIAVRYLIDHELPFPAQYEVGFGIDKNGDPCRLDIARLTAKIDCIYMTIEHDEFGDRKLVVVRDWKTAWTTCEEDLETMQRKIQMIVGWLHHGEGRHGVRAEVVNLRTGELFSRTIWFDDEGLEILNQWRREVLDLCDAADKNSKAVPGAGCIGCPFVLRCEDADAAAKSINENSAVAYAVLTAQRAELAKKIKMLFRDSDAIKVPNGKVGFDVANRNYPSSDAINTIIAHWFGATESDILSGKYDREKGLLQSLGVGVGNIVSIAKSLYKNDKRKYHAFLERCLTSVNYARFGVWPDTKKSDEFWNIIEE